MDQLPFKKITQEEAKKMMDSIPQCIVVDVRTEAEFKAGHIKNAINIPNEEIEYNQPEELPDEDQPILVYCRSGHRSIHASLKLHFLGYKNVYEFGGINTWPYEIKK